jgi:hypothetical protein
MCCSHGLMCWQRVLRYVHEQLLVRIALQLRLLVQPFAPSLLHDLGAAPRLALVQRVDSAEVDLLVDVVLQRGRDIVGMVVGCSLGVVVTMVFVFVVAVRHCCG